MGKNELVGLSICPLCGKEHEPHSIEREAVTIVKGVEVTYQETVFFCDQSKEWGDEYETGSLLDKNMQAIRDAYQAKMSALTLSEPDRDLRIANSISRGIEDFKNERYTTLEEALAIAEEARSRYAEQTTLPFSPKCDLKDETTTPLSIEAFDDFRRALDTDTPAETVDLLSRKPVWE